MEIDTARHDQVPVQLPNWNEGFQLYISEIPGRSILYFERFQQRPAESQVSFIFIDTGELMMMLFKVMFSKRQRKGKPDEKAYFYLKDIEDLHMFRGFALKQNMIFLKLNSLSPVSGVMELKICIHENSITKLSHPSGNPLHSPSNPI